MKKETEGRSKKLAEINSHTDLYTDGLNFSVHLKNEKGFVVETYYYATLSECLNDLLEMFTLEELTPISEYIEFEKKYKRFQSEIRSLCTSLRSIWESNQKDNKNVSKKV